MQKPICGRSAVGLLLLVLVAALGTLAAFSWPPIDHKESERVGLQMQKHYEAERAGGARFVYFYASANPDNNDGWALAGTKQVRAGKATFR